MPNRNDLHDYQTHCIDHVKKHEGAGLFLEMGCGKSIATLTAILDLYDNFEISKVLVIGPLRVARDTWKEEVDKWDHTRNLKLSLVLGKESQRKAALLAKADIYIINRENVSWLIGHYGSAFPFDVLVIDELSSFKDANSHRFKNLRRIRPLVSRVIGLTGTPASNGLIDLWSQLYLLDQGKRLGDSLVRFKERFFTQEYGTKKYIPKDGSKEEIYKRISDICISMKAEDYLQLPERIERKITVNLPQPVQDRYDKFERELVLSLSEDDEISAVNAAGLTNKLLQFANGAVYDDEKKYHVVHEEKIERLKEAVEALNGQNALIFYSYKSDLERILKTLKNFNPEVLKSSDSMKRWCEGSIQLALAHPASAGHGLNLQSGGHNVIWFGLPWSLELYMQANARLHRQGQTKPVFIHRLITAGTMDEDVILALDEKENTQNALMNAIKARVKKYRS